MQMITARIVNEFLNSGGGFDAPDHRLHSSGSGMTSHRENPTSVTFSGPTVLLETGLAAFEGLAWDLRIVPQISLDAVKA